MALILTDPTRRAGEFSPQERLERLAAISAERMNWALMYLSGYAPAVFDAVIDMVEPDGKRDQTASDGRDESESYCARCGQEIEAFPMLALGWQHAAVEADDTVGSFRVTEGEHEPVVAWRPASPLPF
jgi:hypothetical protein